MAHEYVTIDQLKGTSSLNGQTFADADLSIALTAASRAIDFVAGRRFWSDANASVIRYYTPQSAERVWIDDVVTVTEVATDMAEDQTFSQTWTVNSDYFLEPLNAAADGWPWTTLHVSPRTALYLQPYWPRSLRVTGKFGWVAVPEGIQQATTIIATKLVKRSREAPFGVIPVNVDAGAVRIAQQDSEVQLLIQPFVRVTH